MYQQDSFFDLSASGQVGLVMISIALGVLAVGATTALFRRHTAVIRIGGALFAFWLFVWASPQLYYLYYWTIFPDLPMQWVIWPPPGPLKALNMLGFQYLQNLSAHGQGILGWCMLAAPFARDIGDRLKRRR